MSTAGGSEASTGETLALILSVVSLLADVGIIIWGRRRQERTDRQMAKLQHRLDVQLEAKKAELSKDGELYKLRAQRRLEAYPRLVEKLLRLNGLANALATLYREDLAEAFDAQSEDLAKFVTALWLELESDGLLQDTRLYIGITGSFVQMLRWIHGEGSGGEPDKDKLHQYHQSLGEWYDRMKQLTDRISDRASRIISLRESTLGSDESSPTDSAINDSQL